MVHSSVSNTFRLAPSSYCTPHSLPHQLSRPSPHSTWTSQGGGGEGGQEGGEPAQGRGGRRLAAILSLSCPHCRPSQLQAPCSARGPPATPSSGPRCCRYCCCSYRRWGGGRAAPARPGAPWKTWSSRGTISPRPVPGKYRWGILCGITTTALLRMARSLTRGNGLGGPRLTTPLSPDQALLGPGFPCCPLKPCLHSGTP